MSKLAKWQQDILTVLEADLNANDPGCRASDEVKAILRHPYFGHIVHDIRRLSMGAPNQSRAFVYDRYVSEINHARKVAESNIKGGDDD